LNRSEELSSLGSRAVDLVRSPFDPKTKQLWGRVDNLGCVQVGPAFHLDETVPKVRVNETVPKVCPNEMVRWSIPLERSRAPSLQRAGPKVSSKEWALSGPPAQLRPRRWHKVEHVHPGALRGRAVGSAPNIRRTSVNGPSLTLQSRLQRLREVLARLARFHRSDSRVGSLPPSSFLSSLPRPPRTAHVQRCFTHHGPAEAFPSLAPRRRFHTGFQTCVTQRVVLEPCTQTRRPGR
jgi:hypothetical protein